METPETNDHTAVKDQVCQPIGDLVKSAWNPRVGSASPLSSSSSQSIDSAIISLTERAKGKLQTTGTIPSLPGALVMRRSDQPQRNELVVTPQRLDLEMPLTKSEAISIRSLLDRLESLKSSLLGRGRNSSTEDYSVRLIFLNTPLISSQDKTELLRAVARPSEFNANYHLTRLSSFKIFPDGAAKWDTFLEVMSEACTEYPEFALFETVQHFLKSDTREAKQRPFYPNSTELLEAMRGYSKRVLDLFERVERNESEYNPPIPARYDEFDAQYVCDVSGKNCRPIIPRV